MGAGVQGRGSTKEIVVVARGSGGGSQGHAGGGLSRGVDQAETTGPSYIDRARWFKGVWEMGDIHVDGGYQGGGGLAGDICKQEVWGVIK